MTFTTLHHADTQSAPILYVIDAPEHPLPLEDALELMPNVYSHVVRIPMTNWYDALTPWPAPSNFHEEPDFGGQAASTLTNILKTIEDFESDSGLTPNSRAITGYSLGGLFALYTLINSKKFTACACLSGSVWYPGWLEWMRTNTPDLTHRFAFLSVGTKEKRAPIPFRLTEKNLQLSAEILRQHDCEVEISLTPGGHMEHISERLSKGLQALDLFLSQAHPTMTFK